MAQTFSVDVRSNGRMIFQGHENTRGSWGTVAVVDVQIGKVRELLAKLQALELVQGTVNRRMPARTQLAVSYIQDGERKAYVFPGATAKGIGSGLAVETRVWELLEEYLPIRELQCPAWANWPYPGPPKDLTAHPDVCASLDRQRKSIYDAYATELSELRRRGVTK